MLDSSCFRFLTASALEAKRNEEAEEEQRTRPNDRVRADVPLSSDEDAAWRRWMGLPPEQEEEKEEEEEAAQACWLPPLEVHFCPRCSHLEI